ncbi:MAG: hypothetical protein IJM34_05835 [Lachnospiraceae bacterium]|nr:hypothetical protein [Lachnospiraceae bacterium]
MKGKDIFFKMLIVFIILSLLPACQREDTVSDTQTTELPEEKSTKTVISAAEEEKLVDDDIEVAKESIPTEIPKNPYLIDGMHFEFYLDPELQEKYHNPFWEEFRMAEFDHMRCVVFKEWNSKDIPCRVLDSGEKYTLEEDNCAFVIYIPKPYIKWDIKESEKIVSAYLFPDSWGNEFKICTNYFNIPHDVTAKDEELSITVLYEDGSQETLTVYLSQDFTTE